MWGQISVSEKSRNLRFLHCVLVEALVGVVLLVRVAVFDAAVQTRAVLVELVKSSGFSVVGQSFLRLNVAVLAGECIGSSE